MKKLLALILAIALMATMSVTAFAADYDTAGDKGMTVTYSVAPAYTVTIPTDVTIDGNSTAISAENVVVEKGKYVSVSLADDNDFTVRTQQGAELSYTVTANGANVAAGGEILAINPTDGKTGSANITFAVDESAIKYAGTYTGSATFTIAVKDVPTINFTIDGTSYQAEEGMTWAEWVMSPYNPFDYSGTYGDQVYIYEAWVALSGVYVKPTDTVQAAAYDYSA